MVPPAGGVGGVPGRLSAASAAQPRVLEFLRDGRDLLHAVLVRGQVALEGLVLPQQGSQLRQRRRLVILLQQDLFFACKGCSKSAYMSRLSSLVPAKFPAIVHQEKGGKNPGTEYAEATLQLLQAVLLQRWKLTSTMKEETSRLHSK